MRDTLRIVAGVVAGYLVAVLLASGTTALLRVTFEVARAQDPPTAYLVFDLSYSLVYAAVGGWTASRSGSFPWSGRLLAGLSLILGTWTVVAGLDAVHPLAYQWAAALLTPLAILTGSRPGRKDDGVRPL